MGTATGYSTVYLGRGSRRVDGRILTIEHDTGRAARANAYFKAAGLDTRIELRVADALECIALLSGRFDFGFIDIEKKVIEKRNTIAAQTEALGFEIVSLPEAELDKSAFIEHFKEVRNLREQISRNERSIDEWTKLTEELEVKEVTAADAPEQPTEKTD